MRPRLFAAENKLDELARSVAGLASMRPRLFAAENGDCVVVLPVLYAASMRPRLFAAENETWADIRAEREAGFNEAAALRRGKPRRVAASISFIVPLQ